jgi:hypothetical protein
MLHIQRALAYTGSTLSIRLINSRTRTARGLGLGVVQLYKTVEAEDTVIGVRKEQERAGALPSARGFTCNKHGFNKQSHGYQLQRLEIVQLNRWHVQHVESPLEG